MPNPSGLSKLRRGLVLNLFTTHYFNSLIDKRMSSIGLRTRNNRKLAFSQMWRFLFLGRHHTLSFYKFIRLYPRLMGILVLGKYQHSIERLFGRTFKIKPEVFEVLMIKKRLPLFSEVKAIGFDQIYLSWQIPSMSFKWECSDSLSTSTYSPMISSNLYVRELDIKITTSSIEWFFDLLYSAEQIFPSLNSMAIKYSHKYQGDGNLIKSFRNEYEANPEFLQFIHRLKLDDLKINDFIDNFKTFVSKRSENINFNFHISFPSGNSVLADSYVETQGSLNVPHSTNNLYIKFNGENVQINPSKK